MVLGCAPSEAGAWCALVRTQGLGPMAFRRLFGHFGGARAAWEAGPRAWGQVLGLKQAASVFILPDARRVDADLAWLDSPSHHLVPWGCDAYPERLAQLQDAPVALFVLGNPVHLREAQLAIVGTRHAKEQGMATARDFAATLARSGLVITSGLAEGVDGAAHRAALLVGAPTVAVCATGLDRVYPSAHAALAEAIAAQGALVSEYPPGTAPRAFRFPRRNRIIAGLSLGTLVVEAGLRSGALITARCAADYGREVFAIPGSLHNPLARGCHHLIRQGAQLVERAQHVLDELQLGSVPALAAGSDMPDGVRTMCAVGSEKQAAIQREMQALDPNYALMWQALAAGADTIDGLTQTTGLTASKVAHLLLMLEMEGIVAGQAGGRYALQQAARF